MIYSNPPVGRGVSLQRKQWGWVVGWVFLGAALSGCGTPRQAWVPRPLLPQGPLGITHTVQKGQTLWRIARTYGVDLKSVVAANHLDDPRQIEAGRSLWIPGASQVLDVPVVPPSEPSQASSTSEDFIWPVEGRITSLYGGRWGRTHRGVDIAAPWGTPFRASRDGWVLVSKARAGGFGNLIVIDHGDGYTTYYGHASALLVRQGERVRQGQEIGKVGSTGHSTGPHLHFEVHQHHRPENPLYFLP